ncbi:MULTISPECIES: thiol-activated cytolysin family protein [Sphingobacterium]|uniref:Thiol-activated cytolysin family protein n=1 Tax=Sphingobacterium tenebrionis TaxID=3111775 RepID=A0ABU8I9D7_9SPHI|nr:thiol-activated cytolysin family protein [Sphingobacterium sp. CZ-2]QBR11563.1 hypothetical protein E3D81_04980 [Sphingobacterium sp. CZ-2]
MKRLKTSLLLLSSSIFFIGCNKELAHHENTLVTTDSLLSIFKNTKKIENPIVDLTNSKINSHSTKKIAKIIRDSVWTNNMGKTYFVESDNITVSDENYDITYPGAIFKSKDIATSYSFNAIPIRDYDPLPIRISLSIPGPSVSGVIQFPSLDETRDRVGEIISRAGNVEQINSFSYNSNQFTDYNELKYTFGANVDIKKIISVGVLGGGNKIKKKTGVIIKFTQENFTVDMSLPKRTELISVSDVNTLGPYAPTYISSVTYGRMGVFAAETDASYEDFNAAFKAAVKIASVGVDAHVSTEHKSILDKATISIYMKFGPGKAFAATVNGYDDFKKAILSGAAVSAQSYGGPISFRMRSLNDFSLFKTIFKIDVAN